MIYNQLLCIASHLNRTYDINQKGSRSIWPHHDADHNGLSVISHQVSENVDRILHLRVDGLRNHHRRRQHLRNLFQSILAQMIPMLGQCFRQLAIIHVQHAIRQAYAFINPALAYDANFDPAAAARSVPCVYSSLKIFIFGQLILGLGTVACLYVLLLRLPVSLLLCLPLPGLLHEPVVLLYNGFAPVRLMLQHGPGFRVLSRDLFRQCLHLGHKPVDERHHLVHGLLEGIFIFRVFIGTGNKRPQRLRRGHGVIQRVRRQFLQGFLPAQLLAFDGLVLLLLLRHPALQVVSFRAPQ